jgi:hypothetical protein
MVQNPVEGGLKGIAQSHVKEPINLIHDQTSPSSIYLFTTNGLTPQRDPQAGSRSRPAGGRTAERRKAKNPMTKLAAGSAQIAVGPSARSVSNAI